MVGNPAEKPPYVSFISSDRLRCSEQDSVSECKGL